MNRPVRIGWKRGDATEALRLREWLVTNGLGGYASGTAGGVPTRRFHGPLIAAMAAPHGRVVLLNDVTEDAEVGGARFDSSGAKRRWPSSASSSVSPCGRASTAARGSRSAW